MKSDLDLKFQAGQEFTRRDDRHAHCIILELLPETASYLVSLTASAKLVVVPETTLLQQYVASDWRDREDALALLGSGLQRDEPAT